MKNYIWVIIGVLVIGGIIFAVKNVKSVRPIDNTSELAQQQTSENKTITSADGRVSFQVPTNWTVEETSGGKGEFGQIIQEWNVTSYVPTTGEMAMPANSAMVTVQIESGGSNLSLDQLVDCGMKMTCEKVGIDNEQFIKAIGTLNVGTQVQTVATFYDSNILRLEGTVTSGSDQQQNMQIISQIENSVKFSNSQ